MTWDDIVRAPYARPALAGLALAVALLGASTVRALRADAPASEAATPPVRAPEALRTVPPAVQVDAAEVVEGNLFSPDRMAPLERYPMPGDEPPEAPAPAGPPPVRPIVLGTAVTLDGISFATVSLGTGRPISVRVGDTVGTYIVSRIERGVVFFTSPSGERIEVRATRAGI
jgi:hypothetical protein